MRFRIFVTAIVSALALCPLWAGQIALKNGDRITGTVVDTKGDAVVFKSEFMGEVKIKKSAIVSITTEEPVVITLKDGKQLVGEASTEGGTVTVESSGNRRMTAAIAEVDAIRSGSAQNKYEREQTRLSDPPWLDFWTIGADFGMALTRGNATTSTYNTGVNASRTTGFDKIIVYFNQLYATQRTTEPVGATANRLSGGARYDRNFGKKMFAFGTADFDHDEFQDLNIRNVLGGGLGYHVLTSPRNTWDYGAGGTWNRESFTTGLVRNSGEVLFTEESTHKLNTSMSAVQRLSIYPNLSETGEYRLNFEGGLNWKITKFLSWNVKMNDRFISNPLSGNKNNDILFTSGVGFTFSQN